MNLRQLYHGYPLGRMLMRPAVAVRHRLLAWRYASADAACHRLAKLAHEDLVLDVPEFDGIFKLGASSHLLHRLLIHGHYEPELARWARANVDTGRDAIDVGANIGFFTVLLAKALTTGRVLAIEPSSSARTRLAWNVERNGVSDKVLTFGGLAASDNGTAEIKVFEGMEEYSSAGTIEHHSVRGFVPKLEQSPKASIDSLVRQYELHPGFIKIDVEGFEMEVLRGAADTLDQYRPLILSELSDSLLRRNGSSAREVIDFLQKHGYQVADPLFPGLSPGRRDYADITAIPMR